LLVAGVIPDVAGVLPVCPFRALTGLPCPTCGSTRALMALASGDLARALAHQPLTVLVAVAALAWGLWSFLHLLLGAPMARLELHAATQVRAARVAGSAALLNWIYLMVARILT
jgi:hypothetical protein